MGGVRFTAIGGGAGVRVEGGGGEGDVVIDVDSSLVRALTELGRGRVGEEMGVQGVDKKVRNVLPIALERLGSPSANVTRMPRENVFNMLVKQS